MTDVTQASHRVSESQRKNKGIFSASLWLCGKMLKVSK